MKRLRVVLLILLIAAMIFYAIEESKTKGFWEKMGKEALLSGIGLTIATVIAIVLFRLGLLRPERRRWIYAGVIGILIAFPFAFSKIRYGTFAVGPQLMALYTREFVCAVGIVIVAVITNKWLNLK